MDKDELQQQWQQELKKGRHKDRDGSKDLTPGSEMQSELQGEDGIEDNEHLQQAANTINTVGQSGFQQHEMNKTKNKEGAEGNRVRQEERKMENISEGAEAYASSLDNEENDDENSENKNKGQEKELSGFIFAIPFAALLDMMDFFAGAADALIVTTLIRFLVEAMASAVLFLWYVGQVGFSGRKQKKNMAKFIMAALLDLIPIITFLPLETTILLMIWADQKSGGKLRKTAEKKHLKSKEQKENQKGNQMKAAGNPS